MAVVKLRTVLGAGMIWSSLLFSSIGEAANNHPASQVSHRLNLDSGLQSRSSILLAQGQPVQGSSPAGQGGKPSENKEKGEGKSGADAPAKTPPVIVITRPEKPDAPPDPKELKVLPDEQGRVRFNFSRQPWPAVLEWLASVSKLSLDWQELPGDYLNLQTQRDYSLDEARDLINKHLLARGFTMIKQGEMLTVVNISKLNSAVVPRYTPDELEKAMPSEFVRVSFPLEWLLAEKAAEELKPMLSPNGKLTALKELNRIEAMDTAGNLQEIARVLKQTQSADNNKTTVVKEFRLKHRRAGDVVILVESILGLDPKRSSMRISRGGGSGGGDMMSFQIMNQMQQMQQQFQQMQQQQQRSGSTPGAAQAPDPRLIVNDQENSILAHATPDKMEIITQTIRAIDVPNEDGDDLSQLSYRVKPYRLFTADPEPIMLLLKEMGNLSPMCRIQVDEKSKSLILYGNLADHYVTQTLISRLDGSNRKFEVVPLRRLQAEAVAGTIQYLMGAEDEEKPKNQNRFSYFGGYMGNNSQEKKEERPFKVDADIVNNRLLLWANDVELEEVRNLLTKMGETPPGRSNPETMRSFELQSSEDSEKLLQQLKQLWPEIDSTPLKIQAAPEVGSPVHSQPAPQTQVPVPASPQDAVVDATPVSVEMDSLTFREQMSDVSPALSSSTTPSARKVAWQISPASGSPLSDASVPLSAEIAESLAASTTGVAPEIEIQLLPNGRIIYSSPDTAALDRLEDLIASLAPPRRDYQIFHLKHPTTWAYGIEMILDDFFKDDSNKESTYDPWWGTTTTTKQQSSRLSRQKELKIISNDDSRTILVQGATPEQLEVIQELIDVYDQQSASDPQAMRKTEIIQLQYSRAPAIAETVKQVYRDLLSSNDPALQNPNNQQKPSEEPKFTYIYGSRQNSSDEKSENQSQPIKFKGLLSVGVDENSNSVIISSTEGLMKEIRGLIESLDLAAKPSNSVQVHQVRNINTEILQQRLGRSFTSPNIRFSESGRQRPQDDNDSNKENGNKNGKGSQKNGNEGGSNNASGGAQNAANN